MTQHPILFSSPMVQAILAGRKMQTRRILKLKHLNPSEVASIHPDGSGKGWIAWQPKPVSAEETARHYPGEVGFKCPYGSAGSNLYVREEHYRYGKWILDGKTKKSKQKWKFLPIKNMSMKIVGLDPDTIYYNDAPPDVYRKSRDKQHPGTSQWYKRLARFMPKSAARIFLQVESVRVERLQDITEEDAKAEGLACITKDDGRTWKYGIPDKDGLPGKDNTGWPWQNWNISPVEAFKSLWQSINGPDSWAANPWVWVVGFKVISTDQDYPDPDTDKSFQQESKYL